MGTDMQAEEFANKLVNTSRDFHEALLRAYPVDHPMWRTKLDFDDWLREYHVWMEHGCPDFDPTHDFAGCRAQQLAADDGWTGQHAAERHEAAQDLEKRGGASYRGQDIVIRGGDVSRGYPFGRLYRLVEPDGSFDKTLPGLDKLDDIFRVIDDRLEHPEFTAHKVI